MVVINGSFIIPRLRSAGKMDMGLEVLIECSDDCAIRKNVIHEKISTAANVYLTQLGLGDVYRFRLSKTQNSYFLDCNEAKYTNKSEQSSKLAEWLKSCSPFQVDVQKIVGEEVSSGNILREVVVKLVIMVKASRSYVFFAPLTVVVKPNYKVPTSQNLEASIAADYVYNSPKVKDEVDLEF